MILGEHEDDLRTRDTGRRRGLLYKSLILGEEVIIQGWMIMAFNKCYMLYKVFWLQKKESTIIKLSDNKKEKVQQISEDDTRFQSIKREMHSFCSIFLQVW